MVCVYCLCLSLFVAMIPTNVGGTNETMHRCFYVWCGRVALHDEEERIISWRLVAFRI